MKTAAIKTIVIAMLVSFWHCCGTNSANQLKKLDVNMNNLSFSSFRQKIETITDSAQKQLLVDQYLEQTKSVGIPVIENDTTVYFLYKGNQDQIFLTGDMNEWDGNIPMQKLDGTDLHFLKFITRADARLEYWVVTEIGGWPILDPLNPFQVWNGLGPVSELAMPDYERHPAFEEFQYGKKWDPSSLDSFTMPTGVMDYEHQIHVYLPEGYDPAQEYATVYIQDGLDYVEFAIVPGILDYLIEQQMIEPLLAVFITPPNRHQPEVPNRMTEYGLNDAYVSFICDELVPEVEARYSAKTTPDSRLVVGDSYGGLISFYIGFKRSDVFGLAYSQSGYLSFQRNSIIERVKEAPVQPVRIYIDVGLFEHKIGVGMLPEGENDFLAANRLIQAVMVDKEYDFVYREYPEGHNWGNWRRHLIDCLIYFFETDNELR